MGTVTTPGSWVPAEVWDFLRDDIMALRESMDLENEGIISTEQLRDDVAVFLDQFPDTDDEDAD